MFGNLTDLIYEADQSKTKLLNIVALIEKFEKVPCPSHLHHSKFVMDLKNIMEIPNE